MSEARQTLLWAAIEDYAGLWELVWELNSLRTDDEDENLVTARRVVGELIAEGLVSLYWSEEPDGALTPIPHDEASQVLGDEAYWQAPTGLHRVVRASATSAGEAAYAEGNG